MTQPTRHQPIAHRLKTRSILIAVSLALTQLTTAPTWAGEERDIAPKAQAGNPASSNVYSLADLEALALANSPLFLSLNDQIEVARAQLSTAKAFPNPELESLEGHSSEKTPGVVTGKVRTSSITQSLDLPHRRWSRIDAAEAGLKAMEASVASDRATLITQLQQRYYELLKREAELRAAREDASLIDAIRHRIATRVEVGESPRFELIKVDTEALNANKAVQVASVRVMQAKGALRQLVGHSLPADFAISGRLADVQEPPALETLKAKILQNNPDIRKARAELQQSEALLSQAQAQRWPELALKATRDENTDLKTSSVGVVMTIPLWDWKSGPVAEARANLSRARHQLNQQTFSLDQQIDLAFQQLDIAKGQVNALENGIIKQAEAALKVAESAYRFGERGFIDVLDAQRVFRAARNELITARYEFATACSEIERLRVQLLEPSP